MTGTYEHRGGSPASPDVLAEEGACDLCGESADNCQCPVCPVCGAVGDVNCYVEWGDKEVNHGLKYRHVFVSVSIRDGIPCKTCNHTGKVILRNGKEIMCYACYGRRIFWYNGDVDSYSFEIPTKNADEANDAKEEFRRLVFATSDREQADHIFDLFSQSCMTDDKTEDGRPMFDHMFVSTWEDAQAFLLRRGKITTDQCKVE